MTTNEIAIDDLREALIDTISPKVLGPTKARFAVQLMRELRKGERVPLARLAVSVEMTEEETRANLAGLASMGFVELDDKSAVVGMVLSVAVANHSFRVDGTQLYAWCALDSLFLPAVIGEIADIESSCVVTGDKITLRVGPDQVLSAVPEDVWVSVVAPGITPSVGASCSGALVGADGAFCGEVGFLSSEAAAQRWLAGHPASAVLPLSKAFELAQAVWARPFLASLDHADRLQGTA